MKVKVRRLTHAQGLELPAAASAASAGFDLRAAVAEPLELLPGARALVPTGLVLEIPEGFEGQVRPRSGLARDHGISVLNAPGTIDSDYRGEVGVLLVNHGKEPFTVVRGDRVAQLVLAPVAQARFEESDALTPTERAGRGFGSTGRA